MSKIQESNTTLSKTSEPITNLSEESNIDTDVSKIQISFNSTVTHKDIQIFKDLYLKGTPQNVIADTINIDQSAISRWYSNTDHFMYKFVNTLKYQRFMRIAEKSLSDIAEKGEEKNKLTASLAIIDKLGGEEWNKRQEEKGEVKINFGFNVQGNVMVAPTTPE